MSDPLRQLETWAAPLLAKLTPTEQRKLARSIGTQVRRRQRQRIAEQKNPDGSAYAPRKTRELRGKANRLKRRRKMFPKLRNAQHLRVQSTADGIVVGFLGRAARVARVHHYGLRENGIEYPQRQLLGFSSADQELVRDLLLKHLAG
ncbi:phage virion morphogenesis protein [Microbulbifer discodermiae]|uniref:phage virion morphogenesis protein n=1 Tax=Microbulbifer sp. 2201CG32-9 TaxID=3232309 RepID=UPI00345C26FA